MDDPFEVCHVDGTGEGFEERGGLTRRPGTAAQPVRQAAALNPLHDQEGPALVTTDLVDLHDVGVLHPRRQLCLQPEPPLLGGGSELASQHHLQGRQPVEAPVPRLVHDPHAAAPDLGQDFVIPDLLGGRRNHGLGIRISPPLGVPGRSPPAQCANGRAALGRANQRLFPAGSALLEPRQQRIGGGQSIDAATTVGTVAEVGEDAGLVRLREPAQRECTQLLVTRVGQRGLGHRKPSGTTRERTFPAEKERPWTANLTRTRRTSEGKPMATASWPAGIV